MRIRDAKKLHNGDEVISKHTGESISVLNTSYAKFSSGKELIIIEGIGAEAGYRTWDHIEVK